MPMLSPSSPPPPPLTTIITCDGIAVSRLRSTPTTLQYTVSNASPDRRRRVQYSAWALRALCLCAFAYLAVKRYTVIDEISGSRKLQWTAATPTPSTSPPAFSLRLYTPDLFIFAYTIFSILLILRRPCVEDSILVMNDFGLQLSSTGPTFLSRSSQFIPLELIQDVIINEGFRSFEVIYYLAIIVKNHDRLLVVFPNTLPKRTELETIWRDIRLCMYQHPPALSTSPSVYFDLNRPGIKDNCIL
ncbi:GPI-GlcNAc transferase complex, PIG-H component-domain-containing protein [Limtongia smithiae]|uniref:GPI-GlcNAc transferase complex, PIG-H component-domain-containing protein n=1 Tax=Limtongia smithiae TaxID=1125753 RepID=UPI0034CD5B61